MFGFEAKTEFTPDMLMQAVDKAAFRNLGHGAAAIRKTAQGLIEFSDEPSPQGTPPHTQTGRLPRSIAFDAGPKDAVVGPRFSMVNLAGAAHELGQEFRGQKFDARPFMLPALMENLTRFQQSWAGSIG